MFKFEGNKEKEKLTVFNSGTNYGIFSFLWHYQPFEKKKLGFTIPETVTFLHNRPKIWVFHSIYSNKILKKKDQKMTIEDIEERFMKINNKSGIVAVYFYDERANTDLDWVGIGNDFLREDSDESSLEDEQGNKVTDAFKTIRFEYLDKKGLKDLLHNRVKVNHAILQAFVEPNSDYNNTIYVDWSRTHCTVERRFSKVRLNDKRYSIQQRGTTFEKLEGVTDKVNITSKSILQAINEEIFQM